jgi:prepilin-type N-terminal cleavage/methylation domain-containing protein
MPAAACGYLQSIRSVHSSFATLRPSSSRARPPRGFTLLEVLLTIAIIALFATVLIGGSARLLDQQPTSVDEVFWKAVQEARKTALKTEHEIRFRYDREKKQFLLIDGVAPTALSADGITKEEVPLKAFPIPAAATSDLQVDLLGPVAKGGNVILVGGMLLESTPIKFITFYPDGTCSAFRLQISRGGGVHILSIDPWTCAPILTPPDPNALPAY